MPNQPSRRGRARPAWLVVAAPAALALLVPSLYAAIRHEIRRGDGTPDPSHLARIGIGGVPMNQVRGLGWHPELTSEYLTAADRFPTAQACLIEPNAPIESSRIDWYRIGSEVEADVCMSRVIARIRTVDGTVRWLRASGFQASLAPHLAAYWVRKEAPDRNAAAIGAHRPIRERGPLLRRGVIRPLAQWALGHGVSCAVSIGCRSGLVSVQCTTTIL